LRPAIALNELFRPLTEIDAAAPEELAVEDEFAAGVELLLLPHAAMRTAAVPTATVVSPALAVTEYNDVPRLFSRDQIRTPGHLAARA
jgi:hypothetical protein